MKAGWREKRLSEVLKIQNGYAFNSKQFAADVGMPLIRIRDLKGGMGTETNFDGEFDQRYRVRAGDFLIGMDGEFGCFEWRGPDALLNQRVCKLTNFAPNIDARFLFYGINSHLKAIEDVTTFTTVKHLSSKQISSIEFLFPSLEEQRRIVAVLDEAFAAIATATANAEKNLANARELFEAELNASFRVDGKSFALGTVAKFVRGPFGGSLKKEIFQPSGFAVYEQQHAIYDQFSKVRYFVDERKFLEMKRFQIRPGDVLMSCSGTIGKVALIPNDASPGIINQALLKLSPSSDVEGKYLLWFMRSGPFMDQIAARSGGAALQNVASVAVLKEISVTLPNLETQRRISNHIESFRAKCDDLAALYFRKVSNLSGLKQSLLHKAFTGELTATAPETIAA